jgi:hypothetical protein
MTQLCYRLAAMERAGIDIDSCAVKWQFENRSRGEFNFDAVAYIISANIRRRHLTKQQQADLIVAAVKAGEKLDQVEPVSKGGRGKRNKTKQKAVEIAAEVGISEATVKRSIAKAEGNTPKPKGVADDEEWNSALEIARGAAKSAREAASVLREFEDTLEIDDDLLDACRKAANAWSKLLARLKQKRASTLPQNGQSETGPDHSTDNDLPAFLDRRH